MTASEPFDAVARHHPAVMAPLGWSAFDPKAVGQL
jgi:hypothetical protein